jgi:uncharacterized protein with PIN domain
MVNLKPCPKCNALLWGVSRNTLYNPLKPETDTLESIESIHCCNCGYKPITINDILKILNIIH